MKLKFRTSFTNLNSYYISVWREGHNPDEHDQELVDELNKYDLKSKFRTSTYGETVIKCGQGCFGGGYFHLPPNSTKGDVKSAFAKLDGMSPQQVGEIYNRANKDLFDMFKLLSNSNDLVLQQESNNTLCHS